MAGQTTLEQRFGKCPYATAQSLISGKWAVLILLYLEDGPVRFNELLRKMPKMTHATLSVQLKTLEEYGLIERRQYEASLKEYWDYTTTMDTAYGKGMKAGIEKGKEEGIKEEKKEVKLLLLKPK